MAKWGIKGGKDATSVKTVLSINAAGASPRRAKLFGYTIGSIATPADAAFMWMVQRQSAGPTGTSLTPNAFDPADTLACTIVCKHVVTVDGTLTANAFLDGAPLNQRATFRWVARPGDELVIPATQDNGIAIALETASTTIMNAGAQFEEQ